MQREDVGDVSRLAVADLDPERRHQHERGRCAPSTSPPSRRRSSPPARPRSPRRLGRPAGPADRGTDRRDRRPCRWRPPPASGRNPGCEGASRRPWAANAPSTGASGSSPSSPCSQRIGRPRAPLDHLELERRPRSSSCSCRIPRQRGRHSWWNDGPKSTPSPLASQENAMPRQEIVTVDVAATDGWRAAHGERRSACWSCRTRQPPLVTPTDRAPRHRGGLARTVPRVHPPGFSGAAGHGGLRPVLQALQQDLSRAAAARIDRPERQAVAGRVAGRRRELHGGSRDADPHGRSRRPEVDRPGRDRCLSRRRSDDPDERYVQGHPGGRHDHAGCGRGVVLDHLRARRAVADHPETSRVLYVAYAPAPIAPDIVERQLRGVEENLRLVSERLVVEQRRLLTA